MRTTPSTWLDRRKYLYQKRKNEKYFSLYLQSAVEQGPGRWQGIATEEDTSQLVDLPLPPCQPFSLPYYPFLAIKWPVRGPWTVCSLFYFQLIWKASPESTMYDWIFSNFLGNTNISSLSDLRNGEKKKAALGKNNEIFRFCCLLC